MDDLKIIKKQYGEKMMHLCRELFPKLLETPGVLSGLMREHFQPSRFLYDDLVENTKIEEFKNYIYSFVDVEGNDIVVINKTPKELLEQAGYNLYECKTEEEIQSFRKYYAPGEELCTFRGGRLDACDVFFAVKKNVMDISREDYISPRREDEYGTSVISIQFRKGNINTLSIKNRYNHTVNNPDNTFNNNLDNIIPGLNDSFARQYNYNFKIDNSNEFELPNYVEVNGIFYKYNYEFNNVYYCSNNIIIDNFKVIDKYSKEPERYIVLDYFIIDLKEKTIKLYDERLKDGFIDEHKNIGNIVVSKNKETGNKSVEIIYDGGKKATLIINNKNQLIEYHNSFLVEAENKFLGQNNSLEVLKVPNLTGMGYYCFFNANSLTSFEVPSLIRMGDGCLQNASSLTFFSAPNLMQMGSCCLQGVSSLISFSTPKLTQMGDYCLLSANSLTSFEAPSLTRLEVSCLREARSLTVFSAPNLMQMGDYCLQDTRSLISFSAPNLTQMDDCCLSDASSLTSFEAASLTRVGVSCLRDARSLTSFSAPNLTTLGVNSLHDVRSLTSFEAPNLTHMGNCCLQDARSLTIFSAPNLIQMGGYCLRDASSLISFEASNLTDIGAYCLQDTRSIRNFKAPKLNLVNDYMHLYDTIEKNLMRNQQLVEEKDERTSIADIPIIGIEETSTQLTDKVNASIENKSLYRISEFLTRELNNKVGGSHNK